MVLSRAVVDKLSMRGGTCPSFIKRGRVSFFSSRSLALMCVCLFHPRDDDTVYPVKGVLPGSEERSVSVKLMYVRVRGRARGVDVIKIPK